MGSDRPARRRPGNRSVLRAGGGALGSCANRRHRSDDRRAPDDRGDHQRARQHPEPRADPRDNQRLADPRDSRRRRGPPTRWRAQGRADDRRAASMPRRSVPRRPRTSCCTLWPHQRSRNDSGVCDNVVVILIPMLNPDGHRLVVDWYNTTRNTPFEGAPMPWLDHKYAGHDINRDAFMMNMAESRNLSRFFYTTWHPQVFLTHASDGQRRPAHSSCRPSPIRSIATTTRSSGAKPRCSAARWRSSSSATAVRAWSRTRCTTTTGRDTRIRRRSATTPSAC